MGHVLFGAPGIARYHLHDRLARALTSRGHRVTVLTTDPAEFEFWSAQGLCVRCLRPGRRAQSPVPVADFALHDCWLAGLRIPSPSQRERAAAGLARRVGPLLRLVEIDPPDLVLVHQGRTGFHRLLHYVAREAGARVLHTGDGLLPGTMQWDDEGIDGDAAACRRRTVDYRGVKREPAFLAAALAAWLAGFKPPALARTPVAKPQRRRRWLTGVGSLLRGDPVGFARALSGWRAALGLPGPAPAVIDQEQLPPPKPPFVAVLLQGARSPRVLLDSSPDTHPVELALATARAAHRLGEHMPVVAILPRSGLTPADVRRLRQGGILLRPANAAPQAISTAIAVVTVNHPLGIGALLAGTPLVHTGRGPYAISGVSVRSACDALADELPKAVALDTATLRERFLTKMLGRDHLWCSADAPDHNGLNGLITGIETRLGNHGAQSAGLTYRVGPVWPLEPAGR